MSSPFTYGEPSPLTTMPVAPGDDDDDPTCDIPRRLMRVKILYTFDESHKTCCLARLPNALNVPTVPVDDDVQVGVIELRTCIDAIVAASPELVAKLGHDYTVYAYDYSEYETPLVGQGMLSWILAAASPTPDAPATRSKTMVTGKVRENILGLFSGGIKETLEVRLKLVQVPTFLQSEYLETMERYRNVSKALPEGFDHSQWAALKSNPEFSAFAAQVAAGSSQSSMALQRVNSGGVESLHQLLTQNQTMDERRGSQYHAPSVTHSHQGSRAGSRSGSRAGSPTPSMRSSAALQQITHDHSRPVSRGSYTSERPISRHEPAFEPRIAQQQGQESEQEDGPPRKRARVVQTDWHGKSKFGPRADTLRITASTAASLPRPRNRQSIGGTSSLRRESSSQSLRRYASPYAPRGPYSESAIASEDEQMADAEDSPAEFPSSPPVFAQNNDSPAPSSPGLPTLPYPDDSGFMSGTGADHDADINLNDKPDQVHPTTELQTEPPSAVICSDQWQFETPGPPELLPTNNYVPVQTMTQPHSAPFVQPLSQQQQPSVPQAGPQLHTQPQPQQAPATSPPIINNAGSSSDNASITSQRNPKAPKKTIAASKAKKTLPRSNTWSAGTSNEAQHEDTAVAQTESRSASPAPRSGSGAKRKKAIEDRLMQSLASGTMPDFCQVCGAIQTPTWRKAFYKEVEGNPNGLVTSLDEPGAIVGYEVMKPHPDEEKPIAKYKVYKKTLTTTDKDNNDFTPMQLCNPCGLHFIKYGNMRPSERWEVKPRTAPKKRGRPSRKKKIDEKPTAPTSDAPAGVSESSSLQETESAPLGSGAQHDEPTKMQRTGLGEQRRAASVGPCCDDTGPKGWDSTSAKPGHPAIHRAVLSSPPRLIGFQNSPVDIEDQISPAKPTRRVLFPSPRRSGQFKSLEDGQKEQIGQPVFGQMPHPPRSESATAYQDKENVPPAETDDGFEHLFEDLEDTQPPNSFKTPRSAKSVRVVQELMKTPTSRSKRPALTPRDGLFSPGNIPSCAMDDLQSTPSKAMRTPKVAMTPNTQALYNELFCTDKTPRSAARQTNNWNLSSEDNGFLDFSNFDFNMTSTDIPYPSSPPNLATSFNFPLYEDPLTSTDNFWGGTSEFNGSSDPLHGVQANGEQAKVNGARENRRVELEHIIDEVTANARKNGGEEESTKCAETTVTIADEESSGATPAGSEAVDLIPVGL
ncbi:hypothetical protein B0J12DRAFT_579898 [Macrophomina phaseolina]|uniref:Ams2/SPT21 N-terminal domain-containing protein n=1 Tax=Macrophomina phaseolina TaxID=35725 RepID=A0ABQ8G1A1_9PEZI|nr:hypothetical protein B0J12DRAFT_579898 [Macrophomina phaseolina]